MRRGRWRESEHRNDWEIEQRSWRDESDGRRERHEAKDGDTDNRWGWIGRDRGRERLRDVSVTADCADIDPSLVTLPAGDRERDSQRETRGLMTCRGTVRPSLSKKKKMERATEREEER